MSIKRPVRDLPDPTQDLQPNDSRELTSALRHNEVVQVLMDVLIGQAAVQQELPHGGRIRLGRETKNAAHSPLHNEFNGAVSSGAVVPLGPSLRIRGGFLGRLLPAHRLREHIGHDPIGEHAR